MKHNVERDQKDQNVKGVRMLSQRKSRTRFILGKAVAASVVLGIHFNPAQPRCAAALESGIYVTLPGATVEERGDRVPNGSRVVPFSATVVFDLSAVQPSFIAVIPNAVLEGGAPITLTVRSATGAQLIDGSYQFTGDYLRDIHPTGTQYGFDWRFSTAGDGRLSWNGTTAWYGGHIWQITISDVPLVPEPGTSIQVGAGVALLWAIRRARLRRIGELVVSSKHETKRVSPWICTFQSARGSF